MVRQVKTLTFKPQTQNYISFPRDPCDARRELIPVSGPLHTLSVASATPTYKMHVHLHTLNTNKIFYDI